MAFGDWIVGVFMHFGTDGVATMARLRAGVEGVNDRIKVQNGLLDKNAALMGLQRRRVEELRAAQYKYGTMVAGGIALAGGAAIGYGIAGAAALQRSITGVQIATNDNSQAAFQRYAALALHTSGITAQDASTIAEEMKVAATSGLNDKNKLTDAFTRIAKAADVLWIARGYSPTESVKNMSTMAHFFGTYGGTKFQHMLDRAVQMMFVQPEGIQQLVTQGRLFMPSAMSAGVSEEDIFRQAMTMGQTGFLKSRGGSGLARVIEYLSGAATMTGHLSKAQHKAMGILGLLGPDGKLQSQYLDAHGDLQLQKVVDHLEQIRKNTAPTAFLGLMQNAFLAQGGRYMSDILIPAIYQKAQQNWQRMNQIGGVDTIWHRYSNNFLYQWNVFITNISNLFKVTFLPLLKPMTDQLLKINSALGHAVDWLGSHPDWAKRFAEGIILITTTAGAAGAAFAVGTVAQMLKFLGVITQLPNAFGILFWPIKTFLTLMGRIPVVNQALIGLRMAMSGIATAGGGAVGVLSTVAGLLAAIGSVGALFVGMAKDINDAAHNPLFAKLLGWSQAGANYGAPVPNAPWQNPVTGAVRRTAHGHFGGPMAPSVHVHGPINITLPKGTPKQHVSMIIQQLVAMGASANTGAHIPGAWTIGGGMAAYT